jgi:hypothetical protein
MWVEGRGNKVGRRYVYPFPTGKECQGDPAGVASQQLLAAMRVLLHTSPLLPLLAVLLLLLLLVMPTSASPDMPPPLICCSCCSCLRP